MRFYKVIGFIMMGILMLRSVYAVEEVTPWMVLGRPAPSESSYREPSGLFRISLPGNWRIRQYGTGKDAIYEFILAGHPGSAWIQIQHQHVDTDASPKQLILRGLEKRLRKLPHFEEMGRRLFMHQQRPAGSVSGHYWYQGNAQYPRAVEEMYVIHDHDAFTLHFECYAPMAPSLAGVLAEAYRSFTPHPLPDLAPKSSSPQNDSDDFLQRIDQIPF